MSFITGRRGNGQEDNGLGYDLNWMTRGYEEDDTFLSFVYILYNKIRKWVVVSCVVRVASRLTCPI